MTVKKKALIDLYYENLKDYFKAYAKHERAEMELSDLKSRHATNNDLSQQIINCEENLNIAFHELLVYQGRCNGVRNCCKVMLTDKEYKEMEFFAPHY